VRREAVPDPDDGAGRAPSSRGGPTATGCCNSKLTLYRNIGQLNLDVERHVHIHGRGGTNDEFLKIAGKTQ
jgi:hypothetical protein